MVGDKMYVTYDKDTMYSTGCSSSLPSEPYIELDNLDEMFYVYFNCYKVDVENNKVVLCRNEELFSKELYADNINLISCDKIDKPIKVNARVRYNQKEQPATEIGGE